LQQLQPPPAAAAPEPLKNPHNEPSELIHVEAPLRLDVESLCTALRDRMIGNGCKPPTITQAWRDAARRLLDLDKRRYEDALNLLQWSQDHHFWKGNIQSLPKFREKYD